ncbi:PhoH family protein [Allohahella marinimesophila]|uniref:PhoH-like protein n=1 Tax=Allohahella marinimesophila TaxID=1054972 RepID=A0ABP7PNG8_9GAMM
MSISHRGNQFAIRGEPARIKAAEELLKRLYKQTSSRFELGGEEVHLLIQEVRDRHRLDSTSDDDSPQDRELAAAIRTPKLHVKPRGSNQSSYVKSIRSCDINFGVGPAGTGKTYLAVACAVEAFTSEQVRRIMLVRPAVEAGEKLGFLPGDLAQKVDPYLRPLYDALYDMMGFEQVARLMEKGLIEVAPLAFMRGRTLNNAFVILDESQNTTREQMKMFLTRIGFGSTAVITGDLTQVDLPRNTPSGLVHSLNVLSEVDGIAVTRFASRDVVRHPLVQRIVDAYDKFDKLGETAVTKDQGGELQRPSRFKRSGPQPPARPRSKTPTDGQSH